MGLLDKIREAELLKQRQAMTHRWMDNTKVSNPQDAKDFARGGLLGLTTDVLGMPFDIANMIYPVPQHMQPAWGTSDAMAQGMGLLSGSKPETAGRITTGLLSPDLKDIASLGVLGILATKGEKLSYSEKMADLARMKDKMPAAYEKAVKHRGARNQEKIWADLRAKEINYNNFIESQKRGEILDPLWRPTKETGGSLQDMGFKYKASNFSEAPDFAGGGGSFSTYYEHPKGVKVRLSDHEPFHARSLTQDIYLHPGSFKNEEEAMEAIRKLLIK